MNSRKALFLRLLCTKSRAIFGARSAKTWRTKLRKALFLRFPCTKSQAIFGARPPRTWCTNSRKPLILRFLCTKSQIRFAPQPAMLAPGSPRSHIPPSGHANTGTLDPEDVVPGDEGIRVCGERRTTSGLSPGAPATPTPLPAPTGAPGLFLRLCFSSIYKKGIMKWPDWRGADSDEGKGREASNL